MEQHGPLNVSTIGGSPDPPKAPEFHPIKLYGDNGIVPAATQADIDASNWSYEDLARRLPGLVSAQKLDMQNAYKQLTGPLDPTVAGSFLNTATQGSLSAFGGGDPRAGLAFKKGSAVKGAASASVARQTMNYQDQTRQYLEQLMAANPQLWLGLTGADIASLHLYNTGAANTASLAGYQTGISNANAALAQQQAQLAAIGSAVGGITKAYGQYQTYNG